MMTGFAWFLCCTATLHFAVTSSPSDVASAQNEEALLLPFRIFAFSFCSRVYKQPPFPTSPMFNRAVAPAPPRAFQPSSLKAPPPPLPLHALKVASDMQMSLARLSSGICSDCTAAAAAAAAAFSPGLHKGSSGENYFSKSPPDFPLSKRQ